MATKPDASSNPLAVSNVNPHLINVQYAVRGELAVKAEKYRDMLRERPNDHGLPFDRVINANIGNPQQKGLDQPPLTFGRQVCSAVSRVPRVEKSVVIARSANLLAGVVLLGCGVDGISSINGIGQGYLPKGCHRARQGVVRRDWFNRRIFPLAGHRVHSQASC